MNVVDDDGDQDEEVFVDIVDIKTNELLVNSVHYEWVHPLMVPCKLDTGAQANVMSHYDLKHLKPVPKVHKTSVSQRGYDGGEIQVTGRCVAKVCHKGNVVNISFIVLSGKKPAILGVDTCERLGFVKRVYVIDGDTAEVDYSKLLNEYNDVFQGLGCLEGKYSITVDENVAPVVHPARKVPWLKKVNLRMNLNAWRS